MEQIDVQKTEIQWGAEKCCRMFKIGCLPFSPPFRHLHKLREGFVNLKAWQEKRRTNSHIICNAHKAGIPQPWLRTIEDCVAGIADCKRQLKEMESQAKQYRREHLGN
jgi:hypothetical protein